MNDFLSIEEQAAASVVASLARKRIREEDSPDAAGGTIKISRRNDIAEEVAAAAAAAAAAAVGPEAPLLPVEPEAAAAAESPEDSGALEELHIQPFPFFYYKDYSTIKDPDSLTPLTSPGRVPNFPAKMHAILSRPDLADVVCWMPHGRSWKVLKPREFEIRIIPTYFEHAKFSSFIRQANGWGFRRLTTGKDRNSYYHPLFLRALPHLCKDMKRPGVAKKLAADPEHEPDLAQISDLHAVPTKYEDDSVLLQCTLQGGPKARMPIYSGSLTTTFASFASSFQLPLDESKKMAAAIITAPVVPHLTPRDQEVLNSFQTSLGGAASPTNHSSPSEVAAATSSSSMMMMPSAFLPIVTPPTTHMPPVSSTINNINNSANINGNNKISTLATANQLAFGSPQFAAAFHASSAASQFAAGFAAAAALSHAQFQSMLTTMQQQQQQQAAPLAATAVSATAVPMATSTPHNFSLPN